MAVNLPVAAFGERDWERDIEADPVRIGIIGAGWWTRTEALPAFEDCTYCRPTVVADISQDNVRKATAGTDRIGLESDAFRSGAEQDQYDAVYIATPNAVHPTDTAAAAALGKPILCEKPMAATIEGAERMVESVEAADVPLMVAYRVQTDPVTRRAKDLIQAGAIGDIIHVHGQMSDPLFEFIADPEQWRLDPEVSGGGTMSDIAVYPLNTTRFVLEADPEAVHASVESEHEAFADVDEHAAFLIEFPGATTAVCSVSHNAHQSSYLTFHGSAGRLTLENPFFPWDPRRLRLEAAGLTTTFEPDPVNQLVEEFDYFGNCIQRGVDPYPDGRHGLVDVKTVQALYASADRGERQRC